MIYFIGNGELMKSELYEISTIKKCMKWLSGLTEVNLDTETEGMFNHQNKIVMLQLNSGDITYVIDTRVINIKPLKQKLETKLIVGQNLKFDYKFLKFYGIELNYIYDTLLAECCLTNGLTDRKLGLGELALKYCNIKLDKSIRNQFVNLKGNPFTEKQIVYGVGDVTCLTKIKNKQLNQVYHLGIQNWVQNEFNSCLVLADMEYNGMGFDKNRWLELAKKANNNTFEYIEQLDNLVIQEPKLKSFVSAKVQGNLFAEVEEGYDHGRNVNILWSSPTQCDKVFKKLGLNLESTSERFLLKYQNQYPLIKKFIDYKKQAKLVSTYGVDFLKYVNPITQRIHTSFWQILDTTRSSSGNPKEKTPNMQNIPAKVEYRNCFIARPGFKIVSVDYSGQELRLIAEGSKEPVWISTFLNNEDLHAKVASMMFKVPIEEVRLKPDFLRGKSYRDVAKNLNFGIAYGMSKFKLADTLDISIDEADKMIKDYFKTTSKLNKYLAACRRYGVKNGFIKSFRPYSIIRWFPDHKLINENFKVRGEIERASMNTPIQGSAAQMTKRALFLIRKYIKNHKLQDKVFIIMQVHDQIDCEVISDLAEEWGNIQKSIMQIAGKELIKNIPVESEITIYDSWTK